MRFSHALDGSTLAKCSGGDMSMEQWYALVVSFIDALQANEDIRIKDNGYHRVPGVLVTDGVTGFFRDRQFSIWSDIPGELILKHQGMGKTMLAELREGFAVSWSKA